MTARELGFMLIGWIGFILAMVLYGEFVDWMLPAPVGAIEREYQ